jgi:hypothetical protein
MERLRAWWQASPYESRHRTAHFPLRAASPRAAETWEVWDGQDLTETTISPLLPHLRAMKAMALYDEDLNNS